MNLRHAKLTAAKLAVSAICGISQQQKNTGIRVPVLCYHRVLPDLWESNTPTYTLTPAEFAAQMEFLAQHGFQSLSLDEYINLAMGQAKPPERAVLVTFDDGYADNYYIAWKIARHYGIKFNLFLCTGLVEKNIPATFGELAAEAQAHKERHPRLWKPLTWSQVKQMSESGVGIGFHSHSHQNYCRMTTTEIAHDIALGLSLLDFKLGIHPKTFAFPGGSEGTYNPATISMLRSWGLEFLFTTHLGRTPLKGNGNLFSRLVIYQGDDPTIFERKLFGAYDWLGRARSVDQLLRSLWSRQFPFFLPLLDFVGG